jgi:hypothetical protein
MAKTGGDSVGINVLHPKQHGLFRQTLIECVQVSFVVAEQQQTAIVVLAVRPR